jgi:beta-lactamase class A
MTGDVGVALIDLETSDTLAINGDKRFPMQSVFKFHIALAALHLVDEGRLFLDQEYTVTNDHYFKTWSVLMRAHPEANVEVKATVRLLKSFYEGELLSKQGSDLLWKLMVDTPNAPKRLQGMLPEGTIVARKPGTGDTNGEVFGAVNDVGIMVLPNGRKIIIAVFVTRAKGDFKDVEAGIARMSRAVYDHYNK